MKFLFVHACDAPQLAEEALAPVFHDPRSLTVSPRASLYYEGTKADQTLVDTETQIAFVCGYVRDKELGLRGRVADHNRVAAAEISRRAWPLSDAFTGSFGILTYDKGSQTLVLANDAIGIYPLYYFVSPKRVVVASSLILMSAGTRQPWDEIGIRERILHGDYANFGRRTTLQDVKRLLPGEALVIDAAHSSIETSIFDDSLFQDVRQEPLHAVATDVWRLLCEEVALAFLGDERAGLSMSGGLDSRLILGAFAPDKQVTCYTYGDPEFYETKIAARCAEARGAAFRAHGIYPDHFPPRETYMKYVHWTEAVGTMPYVLLLERDATIEPSLPFTLGDLCDLLTGKNITAHRARESKRRVFLRYLLWGRPIPFTELTPEGFEAWKQATTRRYVDQALEVELPESQASPEEITAAIGADLDELYERIAAHRLPYAELLDELFGIYVHGRIAMSRQLLLCGARSFPVAPIMSIAMARKATSIHPGQKLHFRLLDRIFRLKELRDLGAIPTAQVPFVPYRWRGNIKLLIWGLRSGLDKLLIKRQMRLRKPHARHRILPSINWCLAYQGEHAGRNVATWFEPDHIGKKQHCLDTIGKRARLESWPLISHDIGALGGVNLGLLAIEAMRAAQDGARGT